jgi:hypothetical protein
MTAIESERGNSELTLAAFGELEATTLAAALGHSPQPIQRRALEEQIAAAAGVSTLSA